MEYVVLGFLILGIPLMIMQLFDKEDPKKMEEDWKWYQNWR